MKKPGWIVSSSILSLGLILTGCGNDNTASTNKQESKKTEVKAETKKVESKKADTTKKEEEKIDTSVFKYAKKVEVTNAIDLTQHVTIFVYMDKKLSPGLATQHVLNQTYDLLQQKDVSKAKTITIAVKQGDLKISQFTVNKQKFVTDNNKPMVKLVLNASKIDFMNDDVKQYGQSTGLW